MTTQSVLHCEPFARVEGPGVGRETLVQVIPMHAFTPTLANLFFHGPAGKIEPRLVEKSAKLIRTRHPHQNGRGVSGGAKSSFALGQGTLGASPLEEVGQERRDQQRLGYD